MNDDCNTTIKETFQEPRKRFWLVSRHMFREMTFFAANVTDIRISKYH